MIIGSGPGGYVGAIRAVQLGLTVALVERDKPGGVCLNVGCIPSKSLIHQAEIFTHGTALTKLGAKIDLSGFNYAKVQGESAKAAATLSAGVQFLIKKNKIDYISGTGAIAGKTSVKVTGSDGKSSTVTGKNIIIATGGRPRELPGFKFDEKQIISSTGALSIKKAPESAGYPWGRCYRYGVCSHYEQLWSEGDGGRAAAGDTPRCRCRVRQTDARDIYQARRDVSDKRQGRKSKDRQGTELP